MSENNSGITVDYLIELISSVKSALNNIDDKTTNNYEILGEVSQTLNVLTELYKKQNQDQKITQSKLEEVVRGIQDVASKTEIYKQQILSSNEIVNSKVSVINEFKKEALEDVNNSVNKLDITIKNLQSDISYLKNKEDQREAINKSERKKPLKDNEGIFSKIIGLFKTLGSNVGDIYKILMLIVGVLLVTLWLTGHITSEDFKNIVKLKFF